jgi:hypothetical protein
MFNSKTHFEQVPLEFVRKMVEEGTLKEGASEQHQGIEKATWSEVLSETEGRSIAHPSHLLTWSH